MTTEDKLVELIRLCVSRGLCIEIDEDPDFNDAQTFDITITREEKGSPWYVFLSEDKINLYYTGSFKQICGLIDKVNQIER